MTNFFQLLGDIDINSINIAIKKDALNQLTVVVSCSNGTTEKSLNLLSPLFLRGTAKEIDEVFFETIKEPIEKTQGIINNVVSYQNKLDEVTSNTSEEKEKQKKISSYKDKIKEIVDAPAYNVFDDKDKVLQYVSKILDIDKENAFAQKTKKEILIKTTNVGLFED